MSELIYVRTRTGKKIHAAFAGSSVCFCGHWLKVSASRMQVRGTVNPEHICELCQPKAKRQGEER